MGHLTDYKLERVVKRFPWRRRKPRSTDDGHAPVSLKTHEGHQLWADPYLLATFDDPAPALIYVAMTKDRIGHVIVRALVRHHAALAGHSLPTEVPESTRAGLEVLHGLLDKADVDPDGRLGEHSVLELVDVAWALAAGTTEHGE